jgi:hypothetical protein
MISGRTDYRETQLSHHLGSIHAALISTDSGGRPIAAGYSVFPSQRD